MSAPAAKDESGVFRASRSLSLLLLFARVASGSIEFGVGNLDGGGIALDFPFAFRAELETARFSLSDEKDAAGEGERVGPATRRPRGRVDVSSPCASLSWSDPSGDERTARRAMLKGSRKRERCFAGEATAVCFRSLNVETQQSVASLDANV